MRPEHHLASLFIALHFALGVSSCIRVALGSELQQSLTRDKTSTKIPRESKTKGRIAILSEERFTRYQSSLLLLSIENANMFQR